MYSAPCCIQVNGVFERYLHEAVFGAFFFFFSLLNQFTSRSFSGWWYIVENLKN